jgi:chromosome partitioning protein
MIILCLPISVILLYCMTVIITICNGKGGSGKTTLTVLLACALGEAGHHVAILDTDPQKTASRWITAIGGPQLAQEGHTYSALLIDTAPRLEARAVAEAIRRADVVILVTSPSPADLFTSQDMVAVIEREGARGRARILFNQVQPGTILARELAEMAERIGLPALTNKLHRRQAYQHAVLLGWKSLHSEAREEVLKVALEITALAQSKSIKV